MKRTLIIPAIVFAVVSVCASQGVAQTKKPAAAAKKTTGAAPSADAAAGKALIAKSDCMACHKLDVKLVGPGFKQIAKKYPANEENKNALAKKVVEGGSGVWGAIPMSPHPALSVDDAKKIVTYILSVK
ncbi:c-type cytochrome [Pedobacter ginsengisoli]|jgi:cytochrome c|uniref:c-type cytochrome n=1 Tax=Pedobacter ginsengisoli TaxID=363852 RepID=UPI00255011C6|nr:c-type cytochrome [Pedobacter ginsengisoli]